MSIPKYRIGDKVVFSGWPATVTTYNRDRSDNCWIYRVMHDNGEESRWIDEDNLRPQETRSARIEVAARALIDRWDDLDDTGYSLGTIKAEIRALRKALGAP